MGPERPAVTADGPIPRLGFRQQVDPRLGRVVEVALGGGLRLAGPRSAGFPRWQRRR
jgi:hypothetical protein